MCDVWNSENERCLHVAVEHLWFANPLVGGLGGYMAVCDACLEEWCSGNLLSVPTVE